MKNHSCLETMGAAKTEIDICRSLTYSRGSSISRHPLIHLLSQGWKSHWLLHYNHNKVKRKLIELHNGQALNCPSLLVYNASELDVKDQSSWLNTHLNIDQSVKKFIFQKPIESCFRDSFNAAVHLTPTCLEKSYSTLQTEWITFFSPIQSCPFWLSGLTAQPHDLELLF